MAPPSGDKQELDEEAITPLAEREMSTNSLPSIGEIYEGALDDGGVIEGRIEIRPRRRASMESTSNFSIDSDEMSRMTTDSKKKRRSSRKSRSNKSSSSKSKRKGSGSGPSYSEVDLDAAYRMLEEKDIVVSSLVKQVEELQQQLAANSNNGKTAESNDDDDEKDTADELIKMKRLLAEKEAVTECLIEQTKIRQSQLDEKASVIEEQTKEIARLKSKLASAGSGGNTIEIPNHSSRSVSNKSSAADKKKDKKKKSSSSSSGSKRQSSSRKLKDAGETTPTKQSKSKVKLPEEEK